MPRLVLRPGVLPLRHGLSPGIQRIGILTEVPRLLRQFGVPPASVLRKVPLSPSALAGPECQIPFASVLTLLAECAQATGCEHFGLLVGSQLRPGHLGLPGEIAFCSATVGRAIERFTTAHWMNTTGGVAFLTKEASTTGLGYAIVEPGAPDGTAQLLDLTMAIAVGILRHLTGDADWRPVDVQVSRLRPADFTPYRAFFRSPVRFGAAVTMIRFPSSLMERPTRDADEVRCRTLTARMSQLGKETLLPRLYRMIRIALLFGMSSGDELAAAMGLQRRTFDRRLEELDVSYRKALQDVRFEAARQLLRDTDLAVGEIGAALGYAESSPFVRAFRRWSGFSPEAWRRQQVRRALRR